jgi:hypothetical protein
MKLLNLLTTIAKVLPVPIRLPSNDLAMVLPPLVKESKTKSKRIISEKNYPCKAFSIPSGVKKSQMAVLNLVILTLS